MTEARFRFYDFFAGAGMVELGLQADWDCVWANDIDPRKSAVHAANLDHSMYLTEDVAKVRASDLPSPVDMAWASFPCQDLSLAGWRRGITAERSGTFWPFWRLMSELRSQGTCPPLIALENVVGLLHGSSFGGLCEALASLEFQFGAVLIDAAHFLPQSRPRVFVVAVNQDVDVSQWRDPLPGHSPWLPNVVRRAHDELPPALQARWRWWKLPSPKAERELTVEDLIESEPTGVQWHNQDETERLLSLMSPVNRDKVEERRQLSRRSVGFVYKRTRRDGQRAEIRFDGVAGCLRTPYGGSSRQTVVIVEHGQVRSRLLSPREAARLMGVPDRFKLPTRYNDAYRAMGDGVAVPAVSWLSEHLLVPLATASRAATLTRRDSGDDFIVSEGDLFRVRTLQSLLTTGP